VRATTTDEQIRRHPWGLNRHRHRTASRAMAMLGVVALASLTACGGPDSQSSPSAVVGAWLKDLGSGNASGAASLVASSQRACFSDDFSAVTADLQSYQISDVRSSPTSSIVDVSILGTFSGYGHSEKVPNPATILVVKSGSKWYVQYEQTSFFNPPCT
jgi:hypothetical protein